MENTTIVCCSKIFPLAQDVRAKETDTKDVDAKESGNVFEPDVAEERVAVDLIEGRVSSTKSFNRRR